VRRPKHLPLIAGFAPMLIGFTVGCSSDAESVAAPGRLSVGNTRISYSGDEVDTRAENGAAPDLPVTGRNEEPSGDAMQRDDRRTGALIHDAHDSGFIYVFDETDNRIVYSGHLDGGERFILDRRRGRVTIDGVVVYTQDRDGPRDYRVYFDRD
jgi:hypothetical protein